MSPPGCSTQQPATRSFEARSFSAHDLRQRTSGIRLDRPQQGAHSVNEPTTHHHHSSATRAAGGDLSELLDLDAVMTRDYWNEVMDWIAASGPEEVRRIVDLGSGTGAGTISLAERFDRAEIFAIDASDQMLDRTSRKAAERGHADRINVIQADLDSTWPEIGRIDLTWASMSLHHLAHPEELIRRVYSATRPGGQIAIAEFIEPVRFLPDDLGFGVPGLEQRCVDAFRRERLRSLPNFGLQWLGASNRLDFQRSKSVSSR